MSGPISTLLKNKQRRDEYPFALTVDNASIDVAVRIRGNSRVAVCPFPPLRLNFTSSGPDGTAFAGEDKLKLVTHCKNGSQKSQDSVLNEFTAYRIFNLISDRSYRVRLLRIRYEDTDGKQSRLEAPHYGFLIESDDGLANRLGGTVAKIEALLFSELDPLQTAQLNVFQYLIGNKDWSFVTAESDDACCHNIDLLQIDNSLVPIPYDFDLSALTRAKYRGKSPLNQSRRREYIGYCRTPPEMLDQSIYQVHALMDEILTATRDVPALDDNSRERRTKFIETYFDDAADKASLLGRFERNCIGKR